MHDFQVIEVFDTLRRSLTDSLPELDAILRRATLADYSTATPWNMMEAMAQVVTGLNGARPADAVKIQRWISRAEALAPLSGEKPADHWIVQETSYADSPGDPPPPDEFQARAIRYLSLCGLPAQTAAMAGAASASNISVYQDGPAPGIEENAGSAIPSRFGQELAQCDSPARALALAKKRFPKIKPLVACRFLSAVGFPIAVPWPDALRLADDLKLLTDETADLEAVEAASTGKIAFHAQVEILTAALKRAARLTAMPAAQLNQMLALYSGALKLRDFQPTCMKNKPACHACKLTMQCNRFAREQTGLAHPSANTSADNPRARVKSGIKNWALDERPRERMLAGERLSNAELLGIILRSGSGKLSAVELGRELINRFGTLHELDKASPQDIMREMKGTGIGPAKAVEICAAIELGRRVNQPAADVRSGQRPAGKSSDIFATYRGRFKATDQEHFLLLVLNTKFLVQKEILLSKGTMNASIVHPRDVFRVAIRESAYAVIFIHNHPSGDPTPSEQDILLTARLLEASKLMGIAVVDHIIIGSHNWYSFADHGRIR